MKRFKSFIKMHAIDGAREQNVPPAATMSGISSLSEISAVLETTSVVAEDPTIAEAIDVGRLLAKEKSYFERRGMINSPLASAGTKIPNSTGREAGAIAPVWRSESAAAAASNMYVMELSNPATLKAERVEAERNVAELRKLIKRRSSLETQTSCAEKCVDSLDMLIARLQRGRDLRRRVMNLEFEWVHDEEHLLGSIREREEMLVNAKLQTATMLSQRDHLLSTAAKAKREIRSIRGMAEAELSAEEATYIPVDSIVRAAEKLDKRADELESAASRKQERLVSIAEELNRLARDHDLLEKRLRILEGQ
uniref:Uncharacterized protein n=1 Tax=Compsopogon caeruleus TaxID=31354 RepID=A0A7S1TEA6_9RHOD|mmetsp:Transcript_18662/g.39233  ORF Transcript_18662/g.39233 Transcript_18662/m.39233 type:complete len:309 (+) Transcript_18662:218-1144(+)